MVYDPFNVLNLFVVIFLTIFGLYFSGILTCSFLFLFLWYWDFNSGPTH
jgi:hypothetical protein